MEDVWRGEAQDLLSQISQLQEENKALLGNMSIKDCPMTEEDLQRQEGISPHQSASFEWATDALEIQCCFSSG